MRNICGIPDCGRHVFSNRLCQKHYARVRRTGTSEKLRTTREDTLAFVDKAVAFENEDECLIWPFVRDHAGYGRLRINGKMDGAHRYVCARVNGEAPTKLHEAAHSCGKGHLGCVNAKHLRWATHKENHQDRIAHGTNNARERCGGSKLTEAHVAAIKAELPIRKRSMSAIARQYNVAESSIRRIANGETWIGPA